MHNFNPVGTASPTSGALNLDFHDMWNFTSNGDPSINAIDVENRHGVLRGAEIFTYCQ